MPARTLSRVSRTGAATVALLAATAAPAAASSSAPVEPPAGFTVHQLAAAPAGQTGADDITRLGNRLLVAHRRRSVRYRGVIATNISLHHRAAALNLRRLINLGLTRTSGTWHLGPATP